METEVKFGSVHDLRAQIEAGEDRVHFQNIFSNNNGGVALLAFKAGQKLDTHLAPSQLMVNVLEGEIVFTINDNPYTIPAGHFLLLGEGVPHSVLANSDSKVMLVKIKE